MDKDTLSSQADEATRGDDASHNDQTEVMNDFMSINPEIAGNFVRHYEENDPASVVQTFFDNDKVATAELQSYFEMAHGDGTINLQVDGKSVFEAAQKTRDLHLALQALPDLDDGASNPTRSHMSRAKQHQSMKAADPAGNWMYASTNQVSPWWEEAQTAAEMLTKLATQSGLEWDRMESAIDALQVNLDPACSLFSSYRKDSVANPKYTAEQVTAEVTLLRQIGETVHQDPKILALAGMNLYDAPNKPEQAAYKFLFGKANDVASSKVTVDDDNFGHLSEEEEEHQRGHH